MPAAVSSGLVLVGPNLVVVRRERMGLAFDLFPTWSRCVPRAVLSGHRFERIVAAFSVSPRHATGIAEIAWANEELATKLPPGRYIEWLVGVVPYEAQAAAAPS